MLNNDLESARCPNSAQANLGDSQIRGDVLERNPQYEIRSFFQQGAVAFFGTVKLDTFYAVHQIDMARFKNLSKQALNIRATVVPLEETQCVDGYQLGILQHLDTLAAGLAGEQALYPHDDLVFEGKAIGDFLTVFVIINPRYPSIDKINRLTGFSDGL